MSAGIVLTCFSAKVHADEYYTITFISKYQYIEAQYKIWTSPYSIQVRAGDQIGFTIEALDNGGTEKFRGWSASTGEEGLRSQYDIIYYTPSSSMTFTAVFKDTYTVTLDCGEGYLYDASKHIYEYPVFKGESFGSVSHVPAYKDVSKVCIGWSSEPNGELDIGIIMSSFVPESDITLYAIYADACSLTIQANGGCFTYQPEITENRDLVQRGVLLGWMYNTDPVNLNQRLGLAGYSYSSAGEIVIDRLANYIPMSASATLYAQWSDAFIVNLNGGQNGLFHQGANLVNTLPVSVVKNQPVGVNWTPIQGGYNMAFAGWSFEEDGDVDIKPDELKNYTVTKDQTLYAVWVDAYQVFLECGGLGRVNSENGSNSYYMSIAKNTAIGRNYEVIPDSLSNVFIGWSYTPDGGVDLLPDELSSVIVTDTLTLYAVYQRPEPAENIFRISGSGRFQTSMKIADAYKEEKGIDRFDAVIISSGLNFADALAGSYLSYKKNAPILITADTFGDSKPYEEVNAYIKANLKAKGTVYVLGGTGAVSDTALTGLEGYNVVRLKGSGRFETNIEILKEAGVKDEEILVATGYNFADSLSASAVNRPILLVGDELNSDQLTYLDSLETEKFYILGGTGAVKEAVETQLKARGAEVKRLAGKGRHETSVLIAETFCNEAKEAVLAYSFNFPDGLCAGPLASAINGPLILTAIGEGDAAAKYCMEHGVKEGYVTGGAKLVSDRAVCKVFHLIKNAIISGYNS